MAASEPFLSASIMQIRKTMFVNPKGLKASLGGREKWLLNIRVGACGTPMRVEAPRPQSTRDNFKRIPEFNVYLPNITHLRVFLSLSGFIMGLCVFPEIPPLAFLFPFSRD